MSDIKALLEQHLRLVPDFPKPGVLFRDITTLLNDETAFKSLLAHLYGRYKDEKYDFIVGAESRGFIFGMAIASILKTPFVPIRKPGKLPSEFYSCEYDLEYGKSEVQIHKDAFLNKSGAKVLFADDLLATGGTALACIKLINMLNPSLIDCFFLIDIRLGGTALVQAACKNFYAALEV